MEKLLSLLKDGRSRPVELIAAELGTSVEDVRRKIEFLERAGAIRRVGASCSACSGGCGGGHKSCSACPGRQGANVQGGTCSSCMPEGGFKNMGVMWEVAG
ncbi:MAG: Lrp/AsnC family transcriptional regulator [Treponema sp.]|nr:Lrp/AsnC family transcriptional regulator [Treponema sp.]